MTTVSRRLWYRFATIAAPYWFSEDKWIARGLLALLVILQFGQVGSNVLFNDQSREFTSALAAKDAERCWRICDANQVLWPDELLAEAGSRLLIPPSA